MEGKPEQHSVDYTMMNSSIRNHFFFEIYHVQDVNMFIEMLFDFVHSTKCWNYCTPLKYSTN